MTGIAQSFNTFIGHTGKYYSRLFAPKSVRIFLIVSAALLAIVTSVVVTHASLTKWIITDVLNESILRADYDYVYNDEAPPLSDNTYHLQMPMMLEGYLGPGTFVSDGNTDPDNPKIDDTLKITTQESFCNQEDFVLATPDEYEDASDGATEFVVDRPPQSGLK